MACELPELVRQGTTRVYLSHLSAENNTPDLAYVTAQAALLEAGMRENTDFLLQVAERVGTKDVIKF